jgi:hypothetical protein
MTSPVITSNAELAGRARQLAGQAPNGSAERKAALCAAVALAESTSPAGARKILDGWDGAPAAIRRAAIELLGQLTRQEDS